MRVKLRAKRAIRILSEEFYRMWISLEDTSSRNTIIFKRKCNNCDKLLFRFLVQLWKSGVFSPDKGIRFQAYRVWYNLLMSRDYEGNSIVATYLHLPRLMFNRSSLSVWEIDSSYWDAVCKLRLPAFSWLTHADRDSLPDLEYNENSFRRKDRLL